MTRPAMLLMGLGVWILGGCQGPRPTVREVRLLEPGFSQAEARRPASYRVWAVLENRSRGQGQVQVTFRLLDRQNHRTFQQGQRVELRGHERSVLVAEIVAPPGRYRPEVEAVYPPM